MDRLAHGLSIYRSNRLERLAEALGQHLSEPPDHPLASECILVPGRGVAQWLSLELSQRFGVWANVLYLYPRNFVGWALERVLGQPAGELQALDPERLLWSICGNLRALLERPEFETIARYVAGVAGDVRYFELCRRIATTFDSYAAYRPDLLRSWERKPRAGAELPQLDLFGAPDQVRNWQATLWRTLFERSGSVPAATIERRFLRSLQQAQRVASLPSRISCFGMTHLPPSYTRILVALCPHVPISMFQLSASVHAVPALNPLLESLNGMASDFEQVLEDELTRQGVPVEQSALYETPAQETRLSRLQADLLEDRAPTRSSQRPAAGSEPDLSIQIHVCHSAMREVEVLHDQLLAVLSTPGGFEPPEIVVMMPDVETYAPLIEAVFRRRNDDPQRIPYSIADRALEAAAPVANALDRLLLLAGQRLTTSQVLDLLALEPVAARFEITPRDQELIAEWLGRTNVRWGIDAEHRQAHGHPASDANTWRLGIRRLLLGYATESDPPALIAGVLPESGPSGTGAAALGKLALFVETLFQHLDALAGAHAAGAWPEVVGAALEALVLEDPENAWQHQELREALRGIAGRAQAADYAEPICSAALRDLLFDAASSARPGRGFLRGGVTFCSMVPLRSIPFRMVCLLGLGDGQFPRRELSTDFDLITHGGEGRRIGDRSRRSEDRYIFLEAILAARERLLITYTGQSIRDNASLPPSVVVSELCDYLDAVEPPPSQVDGVDAGPLSAEYVVRHPLQAFSRRYFDGSDPRLFSYAEHYVGAAQTPRYRRLLPDFFSAPLPVPPPSEALGLSELVRFYQHPAAYLLQRRLELFLRDFPQALGDREPLELSPLEKYQVGQELLELRLRGVPDADAKELVLARGALPLGTPGELDFQEIADSATPIAELVGKARQRGAVPPLAIQARLPSGRELFGSLSQVYGHGLVEQQFARVRGRHLLALWIRHLAYCWLGPSGADTESSLFGRPPTGSGALHHRFTAVRDPQAKLDTLVRYFDQGQALPLCLFPSLSLAYVQALRKAAKSASASSWEKEWRQELEHDLNLQRVYGTERTFAEQRRRAAVPFETLAVDVFEPLLEHLVSEQH
ncbi:MAG TPA: exodeoxyribonuclease V subunit gamma [Polyangiaceae bacterium]|nr:exodeoxyribonuclease V subunit gamma [Polyangiaceae bacterium]